MNIINEIQKLLYINDYKEVLNLDERIDSFFGIDYSSSEKNVQGPEEIYQGIDPRALLTSYKDYYHILDTLKPQSLLVDLGAGYCRGSLLAQFMNRECLSLELSESRVEEAKKAIRKVNGDESCIQSFDLMSRELPSADAYYLYFPLGRVMMKLLRELSLKEGSSLFVCESHGDTLPFIKELSFLKEANRFKVSLPRHDDYLYEFKIIKSHNVQFEIDDLVNWYLWNEKKDNVLLFKFFHQILKEEVLWPVKLCDLSLELVQDKFYFKHKSGRIIGLNNNEILDQCLSFNEFKYKECLQKISENSKVKKVLLTNKIYLEMADGSIQQYLRQG